LRDYPPGPPFIPPLKPASPRSHRPSKIPGIIDGLDPHSTIERCQLIIAACRARIGHGSYPSILVNSVDLQKMPRLVGTNELSGVTACLHAEVQRLAGTGRNLARWHRTHPISCSRAAGNTPDYSRLMNDERYLNGAQLQESFIPPLTKLGRGAVSRLISLAKFSPGSGRD
jgi:hypothetical protein